MFIVKLLRKLCALLILPVCALAQTAAPTQPQPTTTSPAQSQSAPPPVSQPPAAPPPGSASTDEQHDQPAEAPKPETKLTPEQAQALFRSVDQILKFVSRDTGLPIKHPVNRQLANRTQVEAYISGRTKDDQEAKRLEHGAVVLKKLALLPPDFDLQPFLVSLLKEQVAGYYDSKTRTVYLLDWVEPEQQKPVLAHELTHALQDQNFGLEKLDKDAKKHDPTGLLADERLAARQAMIEGQGMIVMMDYILAGEGSSVAQNPQVVDALQASMTTPSPDMAVFNRAPLFVQQVVLFPYRYGTTFERDVLIAGGKNRAFGQALKDPPETTAQVMQPKEYLSGETVPELKPLDFKKLALGYKKWDVSLMGEFDVFLLLKQYSTPEAADDLSKDWRGGYYWAGTLPNAPQEKPGTADIAFAYVSRWANEGSASRFAGIYAGEVSKRYPGAQQLSGETLPKLETSPSPEVSISISTPLKDHAIWQTKEGLVGVETQGNTVLVMEGFDAVSARAIRGEVFR